MYTATLVSADLAGASLVFEGRPIRAEFSFAGTPLPHALHVPALTFWRMNGTSGVGTWSNEGRVGSLLDFYTPTQADVGKSISVLMHVYYGDAVYAAASTNGWLTVMNVNDLPTGTIRIVGDTRSAGNVLTAVSTIADEDGMGELSYEWRADGQVIAGASASTLTLGQGEAGKNITVLARYVDHGGQAESVASDADPNARHVNTPGVTTLSGAIAAGQTLHIGVVDPDHQGKVYHRWQVADGGAWRDIEGAASSDFTLGPELPTAVRVLTAYADRYGVVESWANTIGTEGADVMTVGDYFSDIDVVETRGGNDLITRGIGLGNRIDGGEGLDTFITAETRNQFGKSALPGYWDMQSITTGLTSFYVRNVERVHFQNGADAVALDYEGHAGQAYRLYQAAFDRTPDKVGQGFWMSRLDTGMSLLEIANAFVASNEFKTLYGANPTNAEIVAKFYQNVLDRAPDAQSQFWVDVLDSKRATVAEVLVGFSESTENVAALIGVAERGIDFTPFTG